MRKRFFASLFLSSFLCAILGYLPPPGPLSLSLYHFSLFKFIPQYASFLLTFFIILVIFNFLILYLAFPYLTEALGKENYFDKIFSRLGLPNYEVFGFLVSIFSVIILTTHSPHYLPLGIFLFLANLSLMLYPVEKRKMGEEPEALVLSSLPPIRKETKIYKWSFPYELGEEAEPLRMSQYHSLDIDLDTLENKSNQNPSRLPQGPSIGILEELIANGITPEVESIAVKIRETTVKNKLPFYVEVLNTVCFAQEGIEYKSDEETTGFAEYWKYPIETLYHQAGDCECKSILTAAIFKILGRKVIILIYPPKEGKPGHMALGIAGADSFPPGLIMLSYGGNRYFYCELTTRGWLPGEIPEELRGIMPQIYEA